MGGWGLGRGWAGRYVDRQELALSIVGVARPVDPGRAVRRSWRSRAGPDAAGRPHRFFGGQFSSVLKAFRRHQARPDSPSSQLVQLSITPTEHPQKCFDGCLRNWARQLTTPTGLGDVTLPSPQARNRQNRALRSSAASPTFSPRPCPCRQSMAVAPGWNHHVSTRRPRTDGFCSSPAPAEQWGRTEGTVGKDWGSLHGTWGVPALGGCWLHLSLTNGCFSPLSPSNMKLQFKGERPFQPVAQ